MSRNKCLGAVVVVSMLVAVGGQAWGQCEEKQKLLAADGAVSDYFGLAAAISDDVALVGAPLDDDNAANAGSTYAFRWNGTTWNEEQELTASDGEAGDFFGVSVGISGTTAIIGGYGDRDNGINSGSAYIFEYADGTWIEKQKLLPSDGGPMDFFGVRLAIDGDVAIVGAFEDPVGPGSAYIFRYLDGTWTEEQKLVASDGEAGDNFGARLAISGNVAMVSAALNDNENGAEAGAAYVYRYHSETSEWIEEQKLLASDGEAGDRFGTAALSGDVAIVGALWDDNENGVDAGAAYVFRHLDGIWTEEQKLVASDGGAGDSFGGYGGSPMAMSDDFAIIGAPFHDANGADSGSAYVFRRVGTSWYEDAKLLASDGAGGDQLGFTASMSGNTVIVGACFDDDRGTDSGSAYVFDLFSCLCLADLNGSEAVDFGDILRILTAWGPCEGDCPEDLDGSGAVDFGDILSVLTAWGPCEVARCGGAFCGDSCENALPVGEGSFPFSTVNSTDEGPNLPEECNEGNGLLFRKDIWFKHTAPCDGTVTASVCDSDFDTRMAVYEYSEDECPGTFLACSDDACGDNGTRSEVSFSVESGGKYLIRIGARFAVGEGTLVIDCVE